MAKRVLVTAALPYANGSIHLGHMLEYIQTDVYVRARKLAGEDVIFMWADDTHGTPIQVRAMREGIRPEALIERAYDEHVKVFDDFGIGYDIFHSTHSEENKKHAAAIFTTMKERGFISSKEIEQLYCPVDEMFLPGRFVKGTCPKCGATDQYGDVCEVCGSTYDTTELKDPYCAVCKDNGRDTTPEPRKSEHLFVPLAKHQDFLREWLRSPADGGRTRLQDSVRNFVSNWLDDLRDWDISRDKPYFGFEIPGHAGKYFYVWFDAPIGYIAATQKWCDDNGRDFDAYWKSNRDETEIVHVIGKDIVYFHTLFWPAMLNAADYTTPSQVQVHGWLKVNGEKMSKTRGTFILARTYLDHLPPSYLRYYFAAKLGSGQEDFDLSMEDFAGRVNADLVNKAANLASRCVQFLTKKLDGKLGPIPDDAAELIARAEAKLDGIPALYAAFESGQALREAIEIAEEANGYLTEQAPWKLAKSDPARAAEILAVGVHCSKLVAAALTPVLPEWGPKLQRALKLDEAIDFTTAKRRLPAGHALGEYEPLAERLDPKILDQIIEASKDSLGGGEAGAEGDDASAADYEVEALSAEVKIDDFTGLDFRVGRVVACQTVEGSKKLLQFTVDLGPLGRRNIFSGIKLSYPDPEALVGKHVVVFANLAARKMRFGVSEGMILASGASDDAVTLLELDPERSRPGERIS